MKITKEDVGVREVMLTIELDQEKVDRALRGAARQVSRRYTIPGFRRGRAPYRIVLQRFGREALLQEVLDDLGKEVIEEALESENLEPYGPGSLEDVELDPVSFTLRVPLRPTVELGNYRELRVEPLVVTVEEDEIDAELDRLCESNAILESAGDRPADLGDWVSLDVSANVAGESLLSEEAYGMVLSAEDKEFEAGFSQQIVGMKEEEEKQFTLALGDSWGEDKAGEDATFTATVREVRTRTLPGLDDDLARTVGDFDTLAELRQSINERFLDNAQQKADSDYTEEVLEALLAMATVEYPNAMVEDQQDDMVQDLKARVESQGISFDDYFKLSGQTEDTFRESLRPRAEARVQRGLALGELARREDLDVEGTEVEERIALLSSNWGEQAGEVRDVLAEPESLRSITSSLLTGKTVQRLVSIAKGELASLEPSDDDAAEEPGTTPAETEGEAAAATDSSVEETPAEEPTTVSPAAEETPDAGADAPPETA